MIEKTIALLLFLFPLAYSPGPGNLFFASNGARFGFSKTIPANLGYHAATFVVTLAIGFGFARFSAQFPTALTVVQYGGSLYVLYLAWGLVRAGASSERVEPRSAGFWDGVVLLVLNPKAYLIMALIFTQFANVAVGDNGRLIVWITVVFTANNLLAFSVWAVMGDRIGRRFREQGSARRLNLFFGLVLALVAVWMLLA